jgi:hypothetical protein
MNNLKALHEFTIDIAREVPKSETREENGAQIVVTTKSIEKVPHFFAFKRPSRNEREDAEAWRVSWWGKYVDKGVLPEAILLRQYSNYGGILDDEQKKSYNAMRTLLKDKIDEYQILKINHEPEAARLIFMNDILDLRDKIMDFERQQSVFFENTAEAKARNKLIEWLVLSLTYHRDSPEKNWESFFKGLDMDERYKVLEKYEEEDNELYLKARDKLSLIGSLLAMNSDLRKEDVELFIQQMNSDHSDESDNGTVPAKAT